MLPVGRDDQDKETKKTVCPRTPSFGRPTSVLGLQASAEAAKGYAPFQPEQRAGASRRPSADGSASASARSSVSASPRESISLHRPVPTSARPPSKARVPSSSALLPRWALDWYQEQAARAETPEEIAQLADSLERGVIPGASASSAQALRGGQTRPRASWPQRAAASQQSHSPPVATDIAGLFAKGDSKTGRQLLHSVSKGDAVGQRLSVEASRRTSESDILQLGHYNEVRRRRRSSSSGGAGSISGEAAVDFRCSAAGHVAHKHEDSMNVSGVDRHRHEIARATQRWSLGSGSDTSFAPEPQAARSAHTAVQCVRRSSGSVARRSLEIASAVRLQASYRGARLRRKLAEGVWAVLRLQAHWRGRIARTFVWELLQRSRAEEAARQRQRRCERERKLRAETQRREALRAAATTIQKFYRAAAARHEAARRLESARLRHRDLARYHAAQENEAAIQIQCRFRGVAAQVEAAARHRLAALRDEERSDAALVLQSRFRGLVTRRCALLDLEQHRLQQQQQCEAAAIIQSRIRGAREKRETQERISATRRAKECAILVIQRRVRALAARLDAEEIRERRALEDSEQAALSIQIAFRSWRARRTVECLRSWRETNWQLSEEIAAAVCIQKAWRSYLVRMARLARMEYWRAGMEEVDAHSGKSTSYPCTWAQPTWSAIQTLPPGSRGSSLVAERIGDQMCKKPPPSYKGYNLDIVDTLLQASVCLEARRRRRQEDEPEPEEGDPEGLRRADRREGVCQRGSSSVSKVSGSCHRGDAGDAMVETHSPISTNVETPHALETRQMPTGRWRKRSAPTVSSGERSISQGVSAMSSGNAVGQNAQENSQSADQLQKELRQAEEELRQFERQRAAERDAILTIQRGYRRLRRRRIEKTGVEERTGDAPMPNKDALNRQGPVLQQATAAVRHEPSAGAKESTSNTCRPATALHGEQPIRRESIEAMLRRAAQEAWEEQEQKQKQDPVETSSHQYFLGPNKVDSCITEASVETLRHRCVAKTSDQQFWGSCVTEASVQRLRSECKSLRQRLDEATEEVAQLQQLAKLRSASGSVGASTMPCRNCEMQRLRAKDMLKALNTVFGLTLSWCGGALGTRAATTKLSQALAAVAHLNPQIGDLSGFLNGAVASLQQPQECLSASRTSAPRTSGVLSGDCSIPRSPTFGTDAAG